MKVKSESEVAQSYLTLSDPMDCSLPGSSVHGILQARRWFRDWLKGWVGFELFLELHFHSFLIGPSQLTPGFLTRGGHHREGNGTPLQYSCLENPMDEGAW